MTRRSVVVVELCLEGRTGKAQRSAAEEAEAAMETEEEGEEGEWLCLAGWMMMMTAPVTA